ncbi:Uncharacterized conserved protein [Plasmopara halstedii]|uniref:Uncharacterized conserved protein n=1 Tax=Plasmopara halstedii TaxID=4781 RepID=A0A0P1AX20_PLAHL|nr:Uncharacterized conserved protein [Plasmopara halstedii]CEG46364.1 Uncharacterized conserved protein [Plasmopara halstedii]|eukprot:XP_024582733.1 Uncharacterized conserved protein [Plasmopara halstedii]
MSSLLQGLKFIQRSESEKRSKREKEKKKNAKSKSKKHKKKNKYVSTSSIEEDVAKHNESRATKALPRDDWMTMPYIMSNADSDAVVKEPFESEEQAKQKKIQDEINAGMREPVTGMVYGLYNPKDPDAAPTVSISIVDELDAKQNQNDDEMPRFGDGGASWWAKMLKQAEEKARASGVAVEEIVRERYGSISALRKNAKGSANDNAHMQYKRHAVDNKAGRERRVVDVKRNAQDKTLLVNYSKRVQQSVKIVESSRHETVSRREEGRNLTRKTIQEDEDEEPVDYNKLTDFDDCDARVRAFHRRYRKDEGSSTRDYNRTSFKRHGRRRSCSSERSVDRKRSRRSHRSRSPTHHEMLRSKQERNNLPEKADFLVEHKETPLLRVRDEAKTVAENLESEKRRSFLYGRKNPVDCKVELEHNPLVHNKMPPNKTGPVTSCSVGNTNENVALNKLAAKALRAQMMGKTALFHKLTEQLNELEAQLEREKTAAAIPHYETFPGALPPLEKEDLRNGSHIGKKKHAKKLNINGPELEASLEELVREERMESSRKCKGNMDAAHARNIFRLGSRYKGSEVNAQKFSSGLDEDEQVNINLLQESALNRSRRARDQREHAMAINDTKHWDERIQKCSLCMKSRAFKRQKILSFGEFTYLAVPNRPILHAGHCVIVPVEHECSIVQADEKVNDEIKRFQTALTSMCEQEYGMSMVFIEQTSAPHRKRHTWIECIPIDPELALDLPLYFKQELMQADSEWSTHQPIIDTSRGGIKSLLPPTFSYFHIEWYTRKGRGGNAGRSECSYSAI